MNNLIRVMGLILFAIGLILLFVGMNSTEAFSEKVVEKFTGRYTDETMGYLIGGGAAIIMGAALAIFSPWISKK